MNKELSKVLRQRIIDNGGLNFVSKMFGMVQTGEKLEMDANQNQIRKRFPIATESIVDGVCQSHESLAIPDSSQKGILYFEDEGTFPAGRSRSGSHFEFESNVRLVVWINRKKVTSENYSEISMMAIADIMKKLEVDGRLKSESFFTGLSVKVVRIPKQDAGIFSRYNYDEVVTQYLRPPYEFFSLDLSCNYSVNPNCISEITLNEPIC